ncbi:MAG: FAD-dependent oxidoreductase [Thermomicrobiales bacterium]|nr:FAD-dependent oxidoreductase [Thermomicrobiales bacterium]
MAITMYGTYWCGDCKRAKQFFGEHRVPYAFVDVDADPEGMAVVERANDGKHIIPVIVFDDGSSLIEPSNAELAAKLNLRTKDAHSFHDLTIVGSGPAGLTAALYAAREGISTLVIERGGIGGQAGVTERLDNFPGFPEGVTGAEFADRLRRQAIRFGVEILQAQEVTAVERDDDYRLVRTADGSEYRSWAVLLAPGSTYRRLDVPGEEDFIGAGVHFCATCDGAFYRGKDVLVIGGGNSAGEEGIFLTRFADRVTIATRADKLSASQVVIEKIAENPKIEVITNVTPAKFLGKTKLESVVLKNTVNGELTELKPTGVFVFVGLQPNTDFVRGLVDTDERGFIVTGGALETNVPGIFAAGDVRAGSTKQAASAAGEGAAVALAIRRYIEPRTGGDCRRDTAMLATSAR